jgi:TRAP-type C4-dicarboxylate transport system substrate-binding protein
MERHLKLSEDQRVKVERILKESHQRLKTIWETVAPQTQDELKDMRAKVREVLDAEQQKQFEEVFKPRPVWPREDRRNRQDGGTNAVRGVGHSASRT